MLDLMRKHAGSWLVKFILAAIIVVFVFWGVGSYKARKATRVALVNGEPITVDEFRNAYNNRIEMLRQQFGNNLTEDIIEMLQVKRQALDQVIDQKLLLNEARRLDIRVSDEELITAIQQISAFQSAGVFNKSRYQNVLNRYRMTPEVFEARQRESMVIDRLQSLITGSVKVSEQEVREWYNWNQAKVKIDYAFFDPSIQTELVPSEEDLSAFFQENQEKYKTAPKRKAAYMHFKPEDFTSGIEVPQDDLQNYYDSHSEEFKTPRTVEARHILFKLDENADSKTEDQARQKALEVLAKANEGEDFAELAKTYSEGPSRERGGSLGAFKREDMVKPFSEKAFSMKAGEISEPVRTRFGWHLIQVEKINEASTRSLAEASEEIRQKLTLERAKNRAYEAAESVYELSFEEDDLSRIADGQEIAVQYTDFFTRQGPATGVISRARFAAAAFELPVMEISDVLDLGDGFYILQVVEELPAKIPALSDVEAQVTADFVRKKQDDMARSDAEAFLSALKETGGSSDKISETMGQTIRSTDWFGRTGEISGIGSEPEITATAFGLSAGNPLPEKVLKGKNGYYVIRFNERKSPDDEGFNKEESTIRERLLQQKRIRSYQSLLTLLRDNSEIEIEDSFLQ